MRTIIVIIILILYIALLLTAALMVRGGGIKIWCEKFEGAADADADDGSANASKVNERVLETVQGKHSKLEVVQSSSQTMGKCVRMDGQLQLCEFDEHKYHEMLVHFAVAHLESHQPRTVLIIGGGDCLSLREVLKYDSIERVVVVEPEQKLSLLCEKHLMVNAYRTDARVKWVHGDNVAESVKRLTESGSNVHLQAYDIAIIDCKRRPGER